jgi:hypothetical protein
MGFRSFLSKPLAAYIHRQQQQWQQRPEAAQMDLLQALVRKAAGTAFGRDHDFAGVRGYQDFKARVPLRDYEDLRPYIDRVVAGGRDVLWPGRPAYYAKTSGTTSGIKYIPISADSMPFHIAGARNALLAYIHETGKADFLDHKLIFLSGSPVLYDTEGVLTGRLSGIVNHHVPGYLRSNQMPSYATNCIDDWEEKLDRIIDETLPQPMSLISGIPPWVQMYFDRIQARTGRAIKDVFPHFSLFIYGGVNFEPYRQQLFASIGKPIDSIETYPASEGFIAYQDSQEAEGLLLLLQQGIFYEFVPLEDMGKEAPRRLHIGEVELHQQYALVMNTNAGLWGYLIGDTVKFVSKAPYRLLVTGRVKHFISAFGEHVIGEEVEKAMQRALRDFPEVQLAEFSVAPQVTPHQGLPHHEWLIAFVRPPRSLDAFERALDEQLRGLNVYYDDLVAGNILRPLRITPLRPDAFQQYMKSIGKLGGQNKVPRLSNDRKIAEAVLAWKL